MPAPSISVVIPCYRSMDTLPAVLDALSPQLESHRDAVVVESAGEPPPADAAVRWSRIRFHALSARAAPGPARNLGAAATTGELLAFLDADTIPSPLWLDRLAARIRPGVEMVAGTVRNGEPRSPVARAAQILEFREWEPGRRGPLGHAPGGNLLVRRSAFEAAGGFPESVWTGDDTLFSFEFGRRGTLVFASDAAVTHPHTTDLVALMVDQYKHGVGFGEICRRVDFPGARAIRRGHEPLALARRAGWLAVTSARRPAALVEAILLSPLLTAGLLAWAAGLHQSQRRIQAPPPARLPQPARPALAMARHSSPER